MCVCIYIYIYIYMIIYFSLCGVQLSLRPTLGTSIQDNGKPKTRQTNRDSGWPRAGVSGVGLAFGVRLWPFPAYIYIYTHIHTYMYRERCYMFLFVHGFSCPYNPPRRSPACSAPDGSPGRRPISARPTAIQQVSKYKQHNNNT